MIAKDTKPGDEFYFTADLRRGLSIRYIRCDDPDIFLVECRNGKLVRHDSGLENLEVELASDVQ